MRIEEVNPVLNAVTEINPDALTIAAALDAERAAGTTLVFFKVLCLALHLVCHSNLAACANIILLLIANQ